MAGEDEQTPGQRAGGGRDADGDNRRTDADALTQLLKDASDLPEQVRELARLVTEVGGLEHHDELGTEACLT